MQIKKNFNMSTDSCTASHIKKTKNQISIHVKLGKKLKSLALSLQYLTDSPSPSLSLSLS